MAVTTTNLGVITAYGDAVAAGYTGTKAEWQALMASYATVGQQAVDAKNDAVAAKNTAVSKATEATTAASTATTKANEASASAQSIAQSAAQIQKNTDDIDQLKSDLNDISEWGGVNYIDNRIAFWYQGGFDGGPNTRTITSNHFELPLGATLTFSRKTVAIGNVALLRGFTSGGTLVWQKEISGFTSTTFTISSSSSISYWQLQIYNSDSSVIAFTDFFAQVPELQLQAGTTATAYTPYEIARVSSVLLNRISTLEDKTRDITQNAQSYLFEVYLEGYNTEKTVVVGQVANKYPSGTPYYSGIYFAYADAPLTWIAGWTTSSKDQKYPCVVPLVEVNSSGVTGYAFIDVTAVTESQRIYPADPVTSRNIDILENNKTIYEYVVNTSNDIVSVNKDMEPTVIQASQTRARLFPDYSDVVEFVHFSDIHGNITAWERIVEYINNYDNYLKFAIHTGDYVVSAQDSTVDLYGDITPNKSPILNTVGNHDVQVDDEGTTASMASTYGILFSDASNWGATFPIGDNLMYYYKDFASQNVRLVVIDQCYWDTDEATWLANVLADAKTNGYHVVTASHTQSGVFDHMLDTPFNTIDDYEPYTRWGDNVEPFEPIIKSFKDGGGKHVAHLCGHWHHDMTGVTENGILNIVIEASTPTGIPWQNALRVARTRTFDCFNIVAVDTSVDVIKVARIGNQYDGYLQHKTVMCIDYDTQTIKRFVP